METGTQTALESFETWTAVHDTHTRRYMGVIERHLSIMGQWVDALKYPTDTFEHQVIVDRLHKDMCALYEEAKETLECIGIDYGALHEIFQLFGMEITAKNIKEIVEKNNG